MLKIFSNYSRNSSYARILNFDTGNTGIINVVNLTFCQLNSADLCVDFISNQLYKFKSSL